MAEIIRLFPEIEKEVQKEGDANDDAMEIMEEMKQRSLEILQALAPQELE